MKGGVPVRWNRLCANPPGLEQSAELMEDQCVQCERQRRSGLQMRKGRASGARPKGHCEQD